MRNFIVRTLLLQLFLLFKIWHGLSKLDNITVTDLKFVIMDIAFKMDTVYFG